MSKFRVNGFSISIEGFGAGVDQNTENPLGLGGEDLHEWIVNTKSFRTLGSRRGETSVDDLIDPEGADEAFTAGSFYNIGAWIMGRNMFGPVRGPWPDDKWKGWWGKNPPYHVPVFVLTHHPRESFTMEGNTTFHFVTDGIHAALNRAKEAAQGKDIRLGGGVATIREYLTAGLIDEMHIAMTPALLGRGEHLFRGIDMKALGYSCTKRVCGDRATHVTISR